MNLKRGGCSLVSPRRHGPIPSQHSVLRVFSAAGPNPAANDGRRPRGEDQLLTSASRACFLSLPSSVLCFHSVSKTTHHANSLSLFEIMSSGKRLCLNLGLCSDFCLAVSTQRSRLERPVLKGHFTEVTNGCWCIASNKLCGSIYRYLCYLRNKVITFSSADVKDILYVSRKGVNENKLVFFLLDKCCNCWKKVTFKNMKLKQTSLLKWWRW